MLYWTEVAQVTVATFAVIEPLDVIEDNGLGFLPCGVCSWVMKPA
jgi:hypothetical protein